MSEREYWTILAGFYYLTLFVKAAAVVVVAVGVFLIGRFFGTREIRIGRKQK